MDERTGRNGVIFQFIIGEKTYNNTVIKRYTHSESSAGVEDYETFEQPALYCGKLRKECILCLEVEIV